jgi:hypothetical protein
VPLGPRLLTGRLFFGVLALLVVALGLGHRLRTGGWGWDAEDWIPTALGVLAGLALGFVVIAFLRRQRTRNRPST